MKLRTCGPPRAAPAIALSTKASAKNFALDKHDANAGQVAPTETRAEEARHKKL